MESILHRSEIPLGSYVVNIVNKPFITPANITYAKTARVDFFNSGDKRISTKEFGYRSCEEIFELMGSQSTDLDYCYVNNFSLSEYRTLKHLPENHIVSLPAFSARNSFFDCMSTVDFSFAHFSGVEVNFESAFFGSGFINFSNTNFGDAAVKFTRTRFGEGVVDFRFAQFGKGEASFKYSHFGNGDVSFVNAAFGSGKLDFELTTFGDGDIDFKYAKFSAGDLSFEKAIFGIGRKDFKAVEFGDGKINFKHVLFNDGNVSFEGAELKKGKISFRMSVFGKSNIEFDFADLGKKEVSFERVEFTGGMVSFYKAKAEHVSFRYGQLNAYLNFKFAQCNKLDLNDTIIRDVVELRSSTDAPVHVNTLNILGMIRLGRIIMDWNGNSVKAMIYSQEKTTWRNKADQFRLLKEEFHNSGKYNDEDKAYVEFKHCDEKAILDTQLGKNRLNAVWAYPLYGFKWLVFDKMGQYATNPLRV
ncbi:MAG TPA: hypothetical protein VN922_03485, partial [Bacteroidia bacterium]|nr:hypothetical protein [Bacteroidia bacterium]